MRSVVTELGLEPGQRQHRRVVAVLQRLRWQWGDRAQQSDKGMTPRR